MSANLSDEGQAEGSETGSLRTGRCHFCGSFGVIVDQFPRRGYGKQDYRMKWHVSVKEKDKSLKWPKR